MRYLAIPCLLSAAIPAQTTTDWPQFLGARGTARAEGASTLSFDREEDLHYRVAVPPGRSSPCIRGDQIFLTGLEGDRLVMLALDRNTGEEQWRHSVPEAEHQEFMHEDAGIAMPTACANDERVFFYLPSYGLVARTLNGEPAWEKKLPEPKSAFGIGTSPTLWKDTVFLLRDGCPDGMLYAFDEATGEETWAVPRLTFRDSHATPYIWEHGDATELIIASTGTVVSLAPESGEEIWRVEGLSPLICTTPTGSEDRLYFAAWSTSAAAGPDRVLAGMEVELEFTPEEREDPALIFERFDADGNGQLVADEIPPGRIRTAIGFLDRDESGSVSMDEWMPLMKLPVTGKNLLVSIKPGGEGNVTDSHVEWSVRRGIPYVSSPLLYEGRIYMIKAGGILSCVDAATGKARFRKHRLADRSEYYATPVGVDGHVVICSTAGTLYVLEVADEVKIVREVDFGERIFATPAFARGTVYVRTHDALYAFGTAD